MTMALTSYFRILLVTFVCTFFGAQIVHGEHITGGELYYECLGNGSFRANLEIYTDCNEGQPDSNITMYVINRDNNLVVESMPVEVLTIREVEPNDLGDCVENPTTPCTLEGFYQSPIFNLSRNSNGYKVVYQRCCRNLVVDNVDNPENIGATYEAFISWRVFVDCGNGSPAFEFLEDPPIQLCAGVSIDIPVSSTFPATADSVRYSLCAPFYGGGRSDPSPSPPQFYDTISYASGFSSQTPLGTDAAIDLDPTTGVLSVQPAAIGNYVVGVCATAYQDGNIYDRILRDFQFQVFDCDVQQAVVDPNWLSCDDYTVAFSQSSTADSYFWNFGVPSLTSDTSTAANPTFIYPSDTGTYMGYLIVNRNTSCEDSASFTVGIYPRFEAQFDVAGQCFNLPVQFTDRSSSTLTNDFSVSWLWEYDGGSSTSIDPSISFDIPGSQTITLTVQSAKGCEASLSRTIDLRNGPQATIAPTDACLNQTYSFNADVSSNGLTITDYLWSWSDGDSVSMNPAPSTVYTQAGLDSVVLIVFESSSCHDTTYQLISARDINQNEFQLSDDSLCVGDVLQLVNTSTGSWDMLQWDMGDGTVLADVDTVNYAYAQDDNDLYGINLLLVDSVCGNTSNQRSVLVSSVPDPGLAQSYALCDGATRTIQITANGDDIIWSDGSQGNQFALDSQTDTFWVSVESNGCVQTDTAFVVRECAFIAPTAFTPNADGDNDIFELIQSSFTDYSMNIYNRWGEKVSSEMNTGWNGTVFDGSDAPEGVYTYIISGQLNDATTSTVSGVVLLLR